MSFWSGWNDENTEQLKTLWNEGLSASQVSRVIGAPSRNSVLSKVHRLGLATRDCDGQSRPRRTTVRAYPSAPPPPPPPPVVEEPPVVLDGGAHVTTMTLTSGTCRWPIGDPAEADFHYCGHAPKDPSPYCAAHRRRAYQLQPVKRGARGAAA